MQKMKKSALSVAIVAASFTSTAQAESFVEDSKLSLTYKNYYWNEDGRDVGKPDAKPGSYNREDWVHGVIADYQSGYFADIIGVDVTAGFASDIDSKAGGNRGYSPSNLPIDSKGDGVNDIAGFQQAYLKAKFGNEDLNAHLTAGQKVRKLETYSDSSSRVLPSSTVGYDAELGVYGVNLYATRIEKFSPRNQSYFGKKLENSSGATIDHVDVYGASYELPIGLGLVVEQGKAKDYLKKTFAKVYYSVDLAEGMSLDLDARYSKAKEDGNLYATDGYDAKYFNYNATLNVQHAYIGVGYSRVKDGTYDLEYFAGDHETFNSSTSLWIDYNLEDEKAWVVSAGYDFAGIGLEGLTYDVWYSRGTDGKISGVKQEGSHHTWENEIAYHFSGMLDGLSLVWYNATSRGYKDNEDANRLSLTYTYQVL